MHPNDRVPTEDTAIEKRRATTVVSPFAAALASSTIAAIVYIATMHRSIGYLDSGEVAAVASTLGIMHPTGYPTLTLLGYVVTAIAPMRDILALNTLAALLAAAGVGAMTLLFEHLLRDSSSTGWLRRVSKGRGTKGAKGRKEKGRGAEERGRGAAGSKGRRPRSSRLVRDLSEDASVRSRIRSRASRDDGMDNVQSSRLVRDLPILSGLAALFIGFTAIWWEQATGFEVYALQSLLLPLVTLLFMRFVDAERESLESGSAAPAFTRIGTAFAIALGLAFTNHMMTVFLAPAFFVYYFWTLGINLRSLRRIVLLIPPFVLGLLPYVYLPLRASMDPRFNWGRPDTWERFTTHVSGKFAWEWMFSSAEVYDAQTSYFVGRLPSELAFIGVAVAALGLIMLVRRNVRLAVWSVLMFAACAAYAGGYRIYDIELYYATSILAIGIWIAFALGWLLRLNRIIAFATGAVLVIAAVMLHYADADRSGNSLAEDVVWNTLTTAPPNAMIFSSNAATFVTGSYYLQAVESIRPDVTVINHDYLSLSWYLDELTDWKPDLMAAVADEVASYREELVKAERKEPFDGFRLTMGYDRMVQAMVDWQMDRGGVLIAGEVERAFGSSCSAVPWHLGYRLVRDTGYVAVAFPEYRFTHWRHNDPFTASIYETYGRRLAYRASYEAEHGHDSLARRYREYALTFDPEIDLENVGELPLDAMSQIRATAEFYARLKASATGATGATGATP